MVQTKQIKNGRVVSRNKSSYIQGKVSPAAERIVSSKQTSKNTLAASGAGSASPNNANNNGLSVKNQDPAEEINNPNNCNIVRTPRIHH
jgi:hypothetical protein